MNMKKQSLIRFHWGYAAVGAGLGTLLFGISAIWFSWKVGAAFGLLLLTLGGIRIVPKHPAVSLALNGAWGVACILLSCMIPSIMVAETGFFAIGHYRVVMNLACGAVVYGACLLLSGEVKSAVTAASTLLMILATVNGFLYQFRGNEFKFLDILSIRTAMNVVDQYTFHVSDRMFYGWALWAAMVFFTQCLPSAALAMSRWKVRVLAAAASCLCALALSYGAPKVPAKNWSNEGTTLNGYLLNFYIGIRSSFVRKPEGYTPEAVEALAGELLPEKTAHRDTQPNILVIMNESFADFSVLGENFRTSQPVTPFVDALEENTIRGHALVSIFGGNTANSEFEFLTGSSMANLPQNSVPYQQYLSGNVYSLPWLLKAYGYETMATHPYLSSGWNRTEVYPRLGFSKSTFLEEYPGEDLIRGFVSDREMYDYVLKTLRESGDKPLFLFGITMQNHGGYDEDGENFSRTVFVEGYDQDYPMAERYLSLLHTSDEAVAYLIKELEEFPEDTVILFFGDHFPSVEEGFLNAVHGGEYATGPEQMQKYMVPFFIWANYDIPEETLACTSLNYLGRYLLEAAGLELPLYDQFLGEMEKTIPALNALGYYSREAGTFLPLEEAQGEEENWLRRYAMVQYNNLFDRKNRNDALFGAYLP